jgi:hypothetical protein
LVPIGLGDFSKPSRAPACTTLERESPGVNFSTMDAHYSVFKTPFYEIGMILAKPPLQDQILNFCNIMKYKGILLDVERRKNLKLNLR